MSARRVILIASVLIGPSCLLATPVANASNRPTLAVIAGDSDIERMDALLEAADRGDFAPLEAAAPTLRDPALADVALARLRAARLDEAGATAALRRLARLNDPRPRVAEWAATIEAAAAFARGDYGTSSRAARRWIGILDRTGRTEGRDDATQLLGISAMLAPLAGQRVATYTPSMVRTARDDAGLLRVNVSLQSANVSAVLDTGANLSVISTTLAQRLKLRMINGSGAIGSGARDAVPTKIAVADRLVVAGVSLRSVAFLVLDDDQLKLPVPGYRLDLIIGFPVLRALRRLTVSSTGTLLVGGRGGAAATDAPLRANGNDIFVGVTVAGVAVPLHLDTGAASSSLSLLFSERNQGLVATAARKTVRTAGAGGATSYEAAALKPACLIIGGRQVILPSLDVQTTASADVSVTNYGSIGEDALSRLQSYTIDFASMTLRVAVRRDLRDQPGRPSQHRSVSR